MKCKAYLFETTPPPVKPWIGGIRNNLRLDFPEKKEFPLL